MTGPPDDRSPLATAVGWATTVMVIAAEMVVPGLVGYWVDEQLGTKVMFTIGGLIVGLPLGMWHLLRITTQKNNQPGDNRGSMDGE